MHHGNNALLIVDGVYTQLNNIIDQVRLLTVLQSFRHISFRLTYLIFHHLCITARRMSTREKNEIKRFLKEIIRGEIQDIAARQTIACLADLMGGCGSATALEQLYEAAHFANLVNEISKKLNKPKPLIKLCILEMMGSI